MCSPYPAQENKLFRDFNNNYAFNPEGAAVFDDSGTHVTDDDGNGMYTPPELDYSLLQTTSIRITHGEGLWGSVGL